MSHRAISCNLIVSYQILCIKSHYIYWPPSCTHVKSKTVSETISNILPNSPPGIEKSASRRLHFWTCVVIIMWLTCVFCPVHTTTFWALEMAHLFALSRPSEMAEKTAQSLLSIISDTVVQREPSCSMAVFAKGERVSCGSPVVWSISHWNYHTNKITMTPTYTYHN